jgi:hypothetical protein
MIRKSKVALISIAAVATVTVVSPTFAQSFSASPHGTGNVLPFTYQPIAPQKEVQQNDRYGYAMVPQPHSARVTRR